MLPIVREGLLSDARRFKKRVVGAPGFGLGASCTQGLVARRINNLY
jgi:hypothetical protein